MDPLTKDYPWYTPYQFAGNTPVWAIDLDGLEPRTSTSTSDHAIVNEKKQFLEAIQDPEFQKRQEELQHGAIEPAPSMLTSFFRTIESDHSRIPFKPLVRGIYGIPNSFVKLLSFQSLGGRPVQGDEEYKSAALTVALTLTPLKGLTSVKTSASIELNVAKTSTTALTKFYPANGGALSGTTTREFLMPGTPIDRLGSGFGKYFSPAGTPMPMRALPPGNTGAYNAFTVLKPFEVESSMIAPAFGQPGLGIQYLSPVNMNTLIKREIIGPIK